MEPLILYKSGMKGEVSKEKHFRYPERPIVIQFDQMIHK